jgi:hypothetical protein
MMHGADVKHILLNILHVILESQLSILCGRIGARLAEEK